MLKSKLFWIVVVLGVVIAGVFVTCCTSFVTVYTQQGGGLMWQGRPHSYEQCVGLDLTLWDERPVDGDRTALCIGRLETRVWELGEDDLVKIDVSQ